MPAWAQTVGARPLRNLLFSALAGMVMGLGLTSWWVRADSGFAIHALGSGEGVSVLITHDHRHVLIVSGSSGPAFSDALDSALTALSPDLDLVLIDPGASADVAERARALDAALVRTLPGVAPPTVDTLEEPITLPFSDSESLTLFVPDGTWHAVIQTSAGPVLLTSVPGTETLPPAALLIALNPDAAASHASEYPAVVGPPGAWSASAANAVSVRTGESIEITIDGNRIRIPAD